MVALTPSQALRDSPSFIQTPCKSRSSVDLVVFSKMKFAVSPVLSSAQIQITKKPRTGHIHPTVLLRHQKWYSRWGKIRTHTFTSDIELLPFQFRKDF